MSCLPSSERREGENRKEVARGERATGRSLGEDCPSGGGGDAPGVNPEGQESEGSKNTCFFCPKRMCLE